MSSKQTDDASIDQVDFLILGVCWGLASCACRRREVKESLRREPRGCHAPGVGSRAVHQAALGRV